jgi:beta-lactamase superfamily II metal-dependent hydrolase
MRTESNYKATCYFLDVGQGTSQVVHLGNHRVVIIDTGRKRTQSIKINLNINFVKDK